MTPHFNWEISFIFRHTIFKERPCIPAMFLLHERKLTNTHKEMFNECAKNMPSLKKMKIPLVMDREAALMKAVQSELPNIALVFCWNHILRDIRQWLHQHGAPSSDITIYLDDLRRLFHCSTLDKYTDKLDNCKTRWDGEFTKYYLKDIHPQVPVHIGRWALEDLHIYNPYSGVTNNQSENLNFVLKELQGWKEVKIDNAVLAFYQMQAYYSNEIRRGLAGMGEYHVLSQYSDVVSGMKEMDLLPTCSPKEIVQRLQGKIADENTTVTTVIANTTSIQGSEEIVSASSCKGSAQYRAKLCIASVFVSFDAKLGVFLVKGTTGTARVVTVFPTETCSCPSKCDCYHILAVKMSIGIPAVNKRRITNLSQLRKNTRSKEDKRSGRKRPHVESELCFMR